MYTEDDKNYEIKKGKSNRNNTDFYTSFNKKNKKNPPKDNNSIKQQKLKTEEDYASFYGKNNKKEVNVEIKKNNSIRIINCIKNNVKSKINNIKNKINSIKNKKDLIKKIIIIAVSVLMLFIIIMLIMHIKNNPSIELDKKNIILNIGAKEKITYKKINTEDEVQLIYTSSDSNIATVDISGQITAMGIGKATITIDYTIKDVKGSKKCNIEVNNDNNVNSNISLNLSVEDGIPSDTWRNTDALVLVKAESVFGIESIKYTVNCENNCNYTSVTDNIIRISNNGSNKLKVIAMDYKKQEAVKEITIKIDHESPTISLSKSGSIVSNKEVEVCATCSDNLSGCKETKVCKKYTSSKYGEVISVYDVAGNKTDSESFNVTINTLPINSKLKNICSLSVTSDGTVKATLREKGVYYGFNSSYTGSNELSKKIDINATQKGETKAKVVYYYVKNSNGTKGQCAITVIKTCTCKDKNSTATNCPVSCTFTSQ